MRQDAGISLAFGRSQETLFGPRQGEVLLPPPQKAITSAPSFSESIRREISSRTPDLSSVAISVADKTRCCAYAEYLPVLVHTLVEAGADPKNITFYIAYGTHERQSDQECRAAYGALYDEFRFVHHDCTDQTIFTEVGTTPRGTPIRLRRDFLKSCFKITFGALSHHYFAGYGGGRKLIFPGLGERAAVYHNHSLFLDRNTKQLANGCQPGLLEGNPLAEDLRAAAEPMKVDLSIHGILDPDGHVLNLIVGQDWEDFLSACQQHDAGTRCGMAKHYDLVLASCGGHPKDINLIQAHKSIHHASLYVRDGGRLILLADCPDGVGSTTFSHWFEGEGGFRQTFAQLERDYEGNGGTALALMTKTRRIRIDLVTNLPKSTCNQIGLGYIDLASVNELLATQSGAVAIIPKASLCLPKQG